MADLTVNLYTPSSSNESMNSHAFYNVYDSIEAILTDSTIKDKEAKLIEYLKEERLRRSADTENKSSKPNNDTLANPYEQARLDKAVTEFFEKDPTAKGSGISVEKVLKESLPSIPEEKSEAKEQSVKYKHNDYFSTKHKDYKSKFNNIDPTLDTWLSTNAQKPISTSAAAESAAAKPKSNKVAAPNIGEIQADLQNPNSQLSQSLQNRININEKKGVVTELKNAETQRLFAALDEEYESKKSTYKSDTESDAEARMRFYNERLPEMFKNASGELKDAKVMTVPAYAKDGDRIKAVYINKSGSGNEATITRELDGKIFINSKGKFEDEEGNELKVKNGKVTIDDKSYAVNDIEPAQVDYKVYIAKEDSKLDVASAATKGEKGFIEQSKLVAKARGDSEELEKLNEATVVIDKTEKALKAREKEDKESGMKTAAVVVGIISALTGLAVALCSGRNGSYMSGGCSNYGGYNNGPCRISDKYGYNRGLTVPYAYDRSNQYLSTIYNNPVKTRASIMRQNGAAAIHAGVGSLYVSDRG